MAVKRPLDSGLEDSLNEISDSLIACSICLQSIVEEVFQCSNGHLFCQDCLGTLEERSLSRTLQRRCPSCQSPLPVPRVRCLVGKHILEWRAKFRKLLEKHQETEMQLNQEVEHLMTSLAIQTSLQDIRPPNDMMLQGNQVHKWFGVILWRRRPDGITKYCVQVDSKRSTGVELPKGGVRNLQSRQAPPHSSGCKDTSAFATARWEMWEETGIWLAWREVGTFRWVNKRGHSIQEPVNFWSGTRSAYVVTEFQDWMDECSYHKDHLYRRRWMTSDEFNLYSKRHDHKEVLACLESRCIA